MSSSTTIEAPPDSEAVPFSIDHLDFKPRCSCFLYHETVEGIQCRRPAELAFRKTCCRNVVLTCRPCMDSLSAWTCIDCDIDFPHGRDMIGEILPL